MGGELTPLEMGSAANQDIFPGLKILTSTSCLDLMFLSGQPGELLKLHNYVTVVVQSLSHVRLFETPWTVDCLAPLSLGFSRQEYWSGLPCPPPGNLPDPGIESESPALAGRFFTTEPPGKPKVYFTYHKIYPF